MGGMGSMGPWNNPNMTPEEREKMMKDGGPWAGAMMGPWASGIPSSKEGQKNFWNMGKTSDMSSPPMTPDQTPRTVKVRPTKPHDVTNEALERAKAQQGIAGFIDTATKCELVSHLAGTIGDHATLESKRRDVAMRNDFCLSEIFNMIDTHKVGYVALSDLEDWSKSGNINLEREDWAVLLDRYDSDNDGYLNFNEFSGMFLPTLKEYRTTMVARQAKGTQTFLKLTLQTKRIVRDLLYSLLTCEENFEYFKHKMTGNSIAVANEIFDFLDRNKDGYITLNEFTASLLDAGLTGKKGEFSRLFRMFDAKSTGKIGFNDFHNPGKTADVEALNVLEDS
jgi:Ca2+-binding EF-hand superfamily protein